MNNSPFIHKFKSLSGKYYIYDVGTSRIVCVSKIIYDIINDFGLLSQFDIISKYISKYNRQHIIKAFEEIKLHKSKGLFSPARFRKMHHHPLDEQTKLKLSSQIGYMCLNITDSCNLRCKYCAFSGTYYFERLHSSKSMSNKLIKKAANFYTRHAREAENKAISIYGGEPLTVFQKIVYLSDVLSNSNSNSDYIIRIDTNGVLLSDPHIANYVIKNNIDLQISLDGPKSTQDSYRVDKNNKPTYDKIISNLSNIKKINRQYYDKHVSFSITLAPDYNLYEINNFFETNELVKRHHIMCSSVKRDDTNFFDRYTPDIYKKKQKQMQTLKGNYINARIAGKEPTAFEKALFEKSMVLLHARKLDEPYDTISINGCCFPGLKKIFVNTNGDIHPCEKVGNAYNIGNIDKGLDLNKIKNMLTQYLSASETHCIKCWAAKICGICFSHAVKNHKFDFERKKENCHLILSGLHDELVTYATILENNPQAFDFVKNMNFR